MTAISARALSRTYPGRRGRPAYALDQVDLTIGRGEVHGLLGPNGAGKTTLCRLLSTVLVPTSGTATVLGHDVVTHRRAVQRSVGIVFGGDRGLYGRLTARQNLDYWAALYGLRGADRKRRTVAMLDRVGLAQHARQRVDTFSRGMKQRLHLARGLVADPPVLLLDEPTAGMDPVAAHDFRALITDLRGDQRTILLTTHDLAEAEILCDRVTVLDAGRIISTGTPAALHGRQERVDARGVPGDLFGRLSGMPGVIAVTRLPDGLSRVETAGRDATANVLNLLVSAGVTDLTSGPPNLEEVYLRLMDSRGMAVASR